MEVKMETPVTPYKPITLGQWMVTLLLMIIPIVNIVLLFVWAFGSGTHPSKANWAKASLIYLAIVIVVYVILFVFIIGSMMHSANM
jgi:hypothetical protein